MIRSQSARQWRCATAGYHVGSVCATLGRQEELPIRVHRAPLRRIRKTWKAGLVVTMNPVTQRLPVHTISPRRLGPVVTLQHQGKRQHPPPPPHRPARSGIAKDHEVHLVQCHAETPLLRLAQMRRQRYSIKRAFKDAKGEHVAVHLVVFDQQDLRHLSSRKRPWFSPS